MNTHAPAARASRRATPSWSGWSRTSAGTRRRILRGQPSEDRRLSVEREPTAVACSAAASCLSESDHEEGNMSDYLPATYREFRASYPSIADALDHLGEAAAGAGPLDERPQRLVQFGKAVGGPAGGAV